MPLRYSFRRRTTISRRKKPWAARRAGVSASSSQADQACGGGTGVACGARSVAGGRSSASAPRRRSWRSVALPRSAGGTLATNCAIRWSASGSRRSSPAAAALAAVARAGRRKGSSAEGIPAARAGAAARAGSARRARRGELGRGHLGAAHWSAVGGEQPIERGRPVGRRAYRRVLDAGAGRVLCRRAELRVAVREGRRVRARRQAVIRRREREEGGRVEPAGEQKAAHHPCLAEPERIEELVADQAPQIGARPAARGESRVA